MRSAKPGPSYGKRMKPFPLVLLTIVVSSAASIATVQLFPPENRTEDSGSAANGDDASDPRIAELERAVAELKTLIAKPQEVATRDRVGVDEASARAAINAWLEANAHKLIDAKAVAATAKKQATDKKLATFVARLAKDDLSNSDAHQIWTEIKEAGLIKEALAFYAKRAEQGANDPQAQTDYGNSLLLAIQHEANPMKKGEMAELADKTFDKALSIDKRHWDARFSKGLSLSFWPDFLGKKAESIRQFEILVEQQEQTAPHKKHASAYLFLGNLYEQGGHKDKALAMWKRGLERFPNNAELKAKSR